MKISRFVGFCTVLGLALSCEASLRNTIFAATTGPEILDPTSTVTGVAEIERPQDYDRVIALSDVHGMLEPLKKLLHGAKVIDNQGDWAGGKTLLVVIGDSIDKGPDSIGVLDLWMKLQTQAPTAGGQVVHLLGNHEASFLGKEKTHAESNEKETPKLISEILKKGLKPKEFRDPQFPHGRFLRSMPIAARVGKWLFSHSGCYPKMRWTDFKNKAAHVYKTGNYSDEFFQGAESILKVKKWDHNPERVKTLLETLSENDFFGSAFGHQPKAMGIAGKIARSHDGRLIKLDTGMNPYSGLHPGAALLFPQTKDMQENKMPEVYSIDASGNTTPISVAQQ